MRPQRRILFAKLSAFSYTNDLVARQLRRLYPDHDLVIVDVRDFFSRHPVPLARNLVSEFTAYGPSVFRNRDEVLAFFFRSPFAFRHISAGIRRMFAGQEHSFDFVLQTQGLFNARLPGVPHLIYTDYTFLSNLDFAERDPRVFRSPAFIELESDLYRQADAVMVMAKHVERTLLARYHCDPARVSTIHVGVNIDPVPYAQTIDRYAAQRILFVGVEWERKGGPELAAAFKAVQARHPDATLDIVGCSPAVTGPGITVHGRVKRQDVAAHMAQASVFCTPSKIEPLGIAAVEASLFALPVVATDVGGFPETITDGKTGFLTAVGDVPALTEALDRLLSDPALCRAMGEAGRERNEGRFNWDAVGERMRAVADHLVVQPEAA